MIHRKSSKSLHLILQMNFDGVFFDTKDFKLDEYLGKGAFGKTYIVQCVKDDLDYVGKIINIEAEKGFSAQDQINLLKESAILKQLNHPSLVKLLGINYQSLKYKSLLEPTILTEFYPNGTLKEILDEEKNELLDPEWTATKKYIFLLGIANTMKYLHKQGIIHGDLKTQNILIDDDYHPKICDYGLSRCFPYLLTKSIQLITEGKNGSPIYVAPEMLANPEEQYGPQVDVYAFGIITYEVITKKEPYFELGDSISIEELVDKIKNDYRPQNIEGISEKMWELITQCWSQNVQERPSFEEIYSKLSQDFSFFTEAVDENEINEYLKQFPEHQENTENAENTENNENKEGEDGNALSETVENVLGGLTENTQAEMNNVANQQPQQQQQQETNKNTRFLKACEEGNVELVKNLLLSGSIDVNSKLVSVLFLTFSMRFENQFFFE